jgi:hypothetical protein
LPKVASAPTGWCPAAHVFLQLLKPGLARPFEQADPHFEKKPTGTTVLVLSR